MSRSPAYYQYIRSVKWRQKSKDCQIFTKKHCIVFPWLESNHCHHMTYRHFRKELPLRDTVPLSKNAHSIIHWPILWKNKSIRPWVNILLRLLMLWWMGVWFFIPSKGMTR